MRNKKVSIVFVVVALMLFVSVIGNAGDLDQAAVEITSEVNGVLFDYIRFLQWVITGVMLLVTVVGIFPELFAAGRTPDISGIFMKFIQAAVVIGITWAIGDLIYNVFGANINPEFLINKNKIKKFEK